MKTCGLWNDLQASINRLVHHSSSLLYDVDNNLAECYNSVLAKFVSGKRVNFSSRGAYQGRCHAAALSFNSQGEYHRSIKKATAFKSPGKYTKTFILKKRHQLQYNAENRRKRNRKIKTSLFGTDKDYGPDASEPLAVGLPDLDTAELEAAKKSFIKLLEESNINLETRTAGQSSNQLWKEERLKRLTASNFGRVCKLKNNTPRRNLVKDMLYTSFKGNVCTKYGLEHEPIAISSFMEQTGFKVVSCGMFAHAEIPYLAASPDGLIGDNAVVEVKCPYKARNMDLEEIVTALDFLHKIEDTVSLKVTHSYYFQIQGQLEITNREICYFIVWTNKVTYVEKITRNRDFWDKKMVPKLTQFYIDHLLVEIVDPRKTRNLEIR